MTQGIDRIQSALATQGEVAGIGHVVASEGGELSVATKNGLVRIPAADAKGAKLNDDVLVEGKRVTQVLEPTASLRVYQV